MIRHPPQCPSPTMKYKPVTYVEHLEMATPAVALPGIRPPTTVYKPVSFAAEREYADNEGWTTIRSKNQKHKKAQK